MIVEVVAVGTELLLGQIVNRNAAHIGAKLAEQGLDAHYQVVVGDNMDRLVKTLVTALDRSDAVIITGGIGPTQDDLTREAICAATGRSMLFNDEYANALRERWKATGREMPANNDRQAEYPEGAVQLPNSRGTAPGLALEYDGTWLFALPGVPAEMHLLLDDEVLPRLRQASGDQGVLHSRILRNWGRSESQVAELLDDLFQDSVNPSVAFLASAGEIKVRITAKSDSKAAAIAMIEPVEATIRERLGSSLFAADEETIDSVIQGLLTERGWTIGTAESATAGLVGAALTRLPGSSAYYRGSLVTYATDLKGSLLGVPPDELAAGVVTESVALAMAAGAVERLGVDVGVGITGSAGPVDLERPAGTMIVAVQTPDDAKARTLLLPGDRERVRAYATTAALHLVRLALQGHWWRS